MQCAVMVTCARSGMVNSRMLAELLDDAEDVIPAPAIQPRRMLAQFVEDLVHLEGGGDRLDQHRGANAAPRDAQLVLGHEEHLVPQPGLQVAFQLGKIEIGPAALVEQLPGVVEEEKAEVEQRARHGLAVQPDVLFRQVPPPRPHHERGRRSG